MTRIASIFFALLLAACQPAHASGAPVPDVLMVLLVTPVGWVLGIAAVVAIVALIVRASRD